MDQKRFNKLLAEYQLAPEVTRERIYLDTLESVMSNSTKVMIDVDGGNNLLYLPLDKIMQSTANTNNERRTPNYTSSSSTTERREVGRPASRRGDR